MTTTQMIGWGIVVVSGPPFVILQIRMWRTIIARWRLQRMIDDVRRSKP